MDAIASLIDRLPAGRVTTHHGELAAHARDRWALAMLQEARGAHAAHPAAVAFPSSTEEVATILAWAHEEGVPIVPRGEGSGRCGGAQAVKRSLVLDLTRMDRILEVDEVSQTVHAEAGVGGSTLETTLARQGLSLGHAPVSMGISTVGGWVATAAAGLTQAGYGGIEDALLGLTLVLAGGDVVRLRAVPRSGTGPDLRRLFVGSEGSLGVITEVTLATARAAALAWAAFRPHSFESGLALLRELVQRPFRPLVARLFDEARAGELFDDPGSSRGAALIVGFDAGAPAGDAERFEFGRLARELGARPGARDLAERWWDQRFEPVARYESVMGSERSLGSGVIADTVEATGLWRRLPGLYDAVRGALLEHAESVGCVVGHVHTSGASLMFPFLLRASSDEEAELGYARAWDDALRACIAAEGTIGYSHGIGLHLAPHLVAEDGEPGIALLRRVKDVLDPKGVMNPGKLIPPRTQP